MARNPRSRVRRPRKGSAPNTGRVPMYRRVYAKGGPNTQSISYVRPVYKSFYEKNSYKVANRARDASLSRIRKNRPELFKSERQIREELFPAALRQYGISMRQYKSGKYNISAVRKAGKLLK